MNNTKLFSILTSIIIIAAGSCSDDKNDNTASEGNILFNGKIIDNDDFFEGSHWNDPHVLYRDGQFIMYASSDLGWDGVVKIYRLVSPDGKSWTLTNNGNPVLQPSVSGWDSHCVETPAVVYFNGKYHMFYTGYDVAFSYENDGIDGIHGNTDDDFASKHFRIGHATSLDGIDWIKDSNNPIVCPTDPYALPVVDFKQYTVAEPGPVVFNNKIYLYFTAIGGQLEVNTTWATIGLVTSSDGTNWSTPNRVLTPDLTLYPRTSGEKYLGFSTPFAIVINNKLHIYCDLILDSPSTQVMIHHVYSSDGEAGWVHDSAPLLERSSYTWTASEIRSPSALEYNNNLYLYFAGHYFKGTDPDLCIGLIVYDQY